MQTVRRPLVGGILLQGLIVFACALAGSAHAQWVWRDADGHTVFSDTPPPPGIGQSSILRQPSAPIESDGGAGEAPGGPRYDTSGMAVPSAATTGFDTNNRPANGQAQSKPAAPPKKSLAEQDAEFRKRQEDRAKAERKEAEEEQKAAQRSAACEQAKSYLQMLQEGTRLLRPDAEGNRNFMDDEQRAAEVQKTQETIASTC